MLVQIVAFVVLAIIAAALPAPSAPATKNTALPGGSAAPTYAPAAPSETPAPSTPTETAPAIQKTGYVLRPSSSVLTDNQDKVDLDTGCPGWGDMHPHVGPSRCGELADLVVEADSLHTADSRPDIIALSSGATGTEQSCRSRLAATPNDAVYSIPAASLRNGEVLCVRTDIGNTAVVRLDKVVTDSLGQIAAVTIDFQVWTEN